jgi:hypothetical protein
MQKGKATLILSFSGSFFIPGRENCKQRVPWVPGTGHPRCAPWHLVKPRLMNPHPLRRHLETAAACLILITLPDFGGRGQEPFPPMSSWQPNGSRQPPIRSEVVLVRPTPSLTRASVRSRCQIPALPASRVPVYAIPPQWHLL